jgi:hypothetical protein
MHSLELDIQTLKQLEGMRPVLVHCLHHCPRILASVAPEAKKTGILLLASFSFPIKTAVK